MKELLFNHYQELVRNYKVNNLVNEHTKLIFVLESPHIDELIHKSPVSGLSGMAMSKVLFGEDTKTPLGIKLKDELKKNINNKIGIMNICSIPMQRVAYINKDITDLYGEFDELGYRSFFDILEKLRVNTKAYYKDSDKNVLQEIILNDFKLELKTLANRKLTFIPCGNTAQTFFQIANVMNNNWSVLAGIPHPSFGNWYKSKYSENIKMLLSLLKMNK